MLLGAIAYHLKRRSAYVPAIFAAVILPHLVYVVAIGGDHFEFRPFDLYFPFLFLLLSSGAKHWARGGLWTTGTAAYLLGILIALVALPYQAHRQYPSDRYRHGFPGLWIDVDGAAAEYMKPERDPIYRLFGLRFVAKAHQSLLQTTTAAFVGVRAEEHEAFLETVVPTGSTLGKLAVSGVLPMNTRIAIDSVGAIPYYSGLPTLDRLVLTDGHFAMPNPAKIEFAIAAGGNSLRNKISCRERISDRRLSNRLVKRRYRGHVSVPLRQFVQLSKLVHFVGAKIDFLREQLLQYLQRGTGIAI